MTKYNQYAITKLSYVKPSREGVANQNEHMKYLTYRPDPSNHRAKDHRGERWVDHGLGNHRKAISQSLHKSQSKQVHAWNLIISPNPRMLTNLTHPVMKEKFIRYLVEHTIDDWFRAQGHPVRPLYSYVYHDKDSELTGMQQPHAHIVMAGTIQPFGINKSYRLQKPEIDKLQTTINAQIERVQERFNLQLDHTTHERNQNRAPEIPFYYLDEKP
jgi:hypothetical protein